MPTVRSIDRIVYRSSAGGHQLVVDESGGRFAPGATPEPGGDEIEIFARFGPAHGPIRPGVRVLGTSGADWMRIGKVGPNRTGINLDVGHDGSRPDTDVFATATTHAHFTLDGAGGSDRLESSGRAPEFLGPLAKGVVLNGREGDDVMVGGPRADAIRGGAGDDKIYGGRGNDRIDAGSGVNHVLGGPGEDEIFASSYSQNERGGFYSGGAGNDSIRALSGRSDRILCGKGVDNIWVDPFDRWGPDCEKPHGPGQTRRP